MFKFKTGISFIFSIILCGLIFLTPTFAQNAGDVQADEGTKVLKIGILMPKVNLVEATGEISPEEALRNTYAVLLKSDTIEVIGISARLTSLALEEAAKNGCDYILNVSLTQEQKKKSGGIFDRIVRDTGRTATRETARTIPYGGGTGERIARTAAQSAIINTGYTMSNMSIKIKKNDKFTLDYKLSTATGDKVLDNTLEEKAKDDADEILMKMLETSGEEIVAYLRKVNGGAKVTP